MGGHDIFHAGSPDDVVHDLSGGQGGAGDSCGRGSGNKGLDGGAMTVDDDGHEGGDTVMIPGQLEAARATVATMTDNLGVETWLSAAQPVGAPRQVGRPLITVWPDYENWRPSNARAGLVG